MASTDAGSATEPGVYRSAECIVHDVYGFKDHYVRNNRRATEKNLRCFPQCNLKGHVNQGFCGSGCLLRIKLLPSASGLRHEQLLCLVELSPVAKVPEGAPVEGDVRRLGDLRACVKKLDQDPWKVPYHLGKPLPAGGSIPTVVSEAETGGQMGDFKFAPTHWHYGWRSNKHTNQAEHCLRVYVFAVPSGSEAATADDDAEARCIAACTFGSFKISSTKKRSPASKSKGATKQRARQAKAAAGTRRGRPAADATDGSSRKADAPPRKRRKNQDDPKTPPSTPPYGPASSQAESKVLQIPASLKPDPFIPLGGSSMSLDGDSSFGRSTSGHRMSGKTEALMGLDTFEFDPDRVIGPNRWDDDGGDGNASPVTRSATATIRVEVAATGGSSTGDVAGAATTSFERPTGPSLKQFTSMDSISSLNDYVVHAFDEDSYKSVASSKTVYDEERNSYTKLYAEQELADQVMSFEVMDVVQAEAAPGLNAAPPPDSGLAVSEKPRGASGADASAAAAPPSTGATAAAETRARGSSGTDGSTAGEAEATPRGLVVDSRGADSELPRAALVSLSADSTTDGIVRAPVVSSAGDGDVEAQVPLAVPSAHSSGARGDATSAPASSEAPAAAIRDQSGGTTSSAAVAIEMPLVEVPATSAPQQQSFCSWIQRNRQSPKLWGFVALMVIVIGALIVAIVLISSAGNGGGGDSGDSTASASGRRLLMLTARAVGLGLS